MALHFQEKIAFAKDAFILESDALRLVDDPLRRHGQRTAADHGAAAAEGAGSLLRNECVAVQNRHVIHRRMQQFGGDLRPYGFMPLTVRAGAGEHGDFAGALNPHRAALKACAAAGLDEG